MNAIISPSGRSPFPPKRSSNWGSESPPRSRAAAGLADRPAADPSRFLALVPTSIGPADNLSNAWHSAQCNPTTARERRLHGRSHPLGTPECTLRSRCTHQGECKPFRNLRKSTRRDKRSSKICLCSPYLLTRRGPHEGKEDSLSDTVSDEDVAVPSISHTSAESKLASVASLALKKAIHRRPKSANALSALLSDGR